VVCTFFVAKHSNLHLQTKGDLKYLKLPYLLIFLLDFFRTMISINQHKYQLNRQDITNSRFLCYWTVIPCLENKKGAILLIIHKLSLRGSTSLHFFRGLFIVKLLALNIQACHRQSSRCSPTHFILTNQNRLFWYTPICLIKRFLVLNLYK